MSTSNTPANGTRRQSSLLRRSHRWLGAGLAVFLLLLSCTGIALNHSDDWRLGDRYITWSWLLDVYGIRVPEPGASFSDNDHYVALLGQRLYFNEHEIADRVDFLTGLVVVGDLALVTTDRRAVVLTSGGDLVESLDLSHLLPGAIEQAGRANDRVIVLSGSTMLQSDAQMSKFELWASSGEDSDIAWSRAAPLPATLAETLRGQYRGRGVSVERLVGDLHSGRFVGSLGPLFADVIAILLIVLSVTGLFLWTRPRGRQNNNRNGR